MLQVRLDYPLADRRPVAPVREDVRACATDPPHVAATASPWLALPAAAVLAFALSHCDPSSAGRHSADMVGPGPLERQPAITGRLQRGRL
jgi:hypothetical protein